MNGFAVLLEKADPSDIDPLDGIFVVVNATGAMAPQEDVLGIINRKADGTYYLERFLGGNGFFYDDTPEGCFARIKENYPGVTLGVLKTNEWL